MEVVVAKTLNAAIDETASLCLVYSYKERNLYQMMLFNIFQTNIRNIISYDLM